MSATPFFSRRDKEIYFSGGGKRTNGSQVRVCPMIEFEFISTNIRKDFSVPINPIIWLVLKKTQARKFEL